VEGLAPNPKYASEMGSFLFSFWKSFFFFLFLLPFSSPYFPIPNQCLSRKAGQYHTPLPIIAFFHFVILLMSILAGFL